ncbi:MAG: T9SS type A sorting domain-containing protein, partial [candidate division Zixibacteria bacterium]|nr:T9SS type A sorting domain-containing protein [candidate division Zixibacteria bacterium]
TYGGINNERGYCIRKYDEECYIIAGYTGSFGAGGRDFWLLNFSEERTAINDDNIQLVKGPVLINNYPNPFNSTTNICYYLANDENISLSIYNLAGKRIETLINSYIQSGQHNITWDASGYSSGVYFYKLTTENQTFTKRMVLLK